jgi:DNA mismatch repair protein MutL
VLDQDTRSKIAAGEVVERPASVVKELVENSIDAAATAITVEIENGGMTLIRVTDNGEGMEREDAVLAFERHATSKIARADDLEAIFTLGFRGEALASIAAVSKVRMETVRQGSSEGTFVEIEGGKLISQGVIGRPGGTSVTVSDLFYNTPARLKYVKSPKTEASRIKDIIDRFVLGYPHLSFRYLSVGKQVLYSPGTGHLDEAIAAVYGHETAKKMISVQYEWEGIEINGYIGSPDTARANRAFQTFFVNGRYIRSPLLSRALEEAFSTLIMVNRFPMCVINITLDPHDVDVNVHPAKTEVRFTDDRRVAAVFFHAIKRALSGDGMSSEQDQDNGIIEPVREDGQQAQTERNLDRQPVLPWVDNGRSYHQQNFASIDKVNDDRGAYEAPSMRVIGVLFSTYLLIEKTDQLYIIDQHAAHERILYEQYMSMLQKQHLELQYLVSPLVLDITPQERQLLEDNMELLRSMGFEIEEFDSDTYVLRAVPVLFGRPRAEGLLKDIIDGMRLFDAHSPYDYRREEVMMMACRSAVKAHDRLDQSQIIRLADEILSGNVPPTCPHGRPIVRSVSKYELEKMFKRIQ